MNIHTTTGGGGSVGFQAQQPSAPACVCLVGVRAGIHEASAIEWAPAQMAALIRSLSAMRALPDLPF